MTYFLIKKFELNRSGDLVPVKYYPYVIRPCELSYKKVLDFYAGKMPKHFTLDLKGAISSLYGGDEKIISLQEC